MQHSNRKFGKCRRKLNAVFRCNRQKKKCSGSRTLNTLEPANVLINNKPMKDYLAREILEMIVEQPFKLIGMSEKFDLRVNVAGGGLSGQAGAIRHGISRALVYI